VSVNVTPKETSIEQIDQQILFVERNGKMTVLRHVLTGEDVDRAIVFTRTKRGANAVAQRLSKGGIPAAAIHGNKSQNARQRALADFRGRRVRVLVATDVAARGIDIEGVSHVINHDIPDEPESYVHRIGRTGRAGASGVALSLCAGSERGEWRAIEKLIGHKVDAAPSALRAVAKEAGEAEPVDARPQRPARKRSSGSKRPAAEKPQRSRNRSSNGAPTARNGRQPGRRRKSQARGGARIGVVVQ
jgi:ATP-dependent RNA helicase RhlE